MTMRSSAFKIAHTGDHRLHVGANATIGSDEVRTSVEKPEHMEEEEWIRARVFIVREDIEMVICFLREICTEESCPCMTAGRRYAYSWADEQNPRPVDLSAPRYMDRLLEYSFEAINAGKLDADPDTGLYPPEFKATVRLLMKRFFRVYAHLYIEHFREIQELSSEAHLNMFFKHFMAFVNEFNLVGTRDLAPLAEMLQKWESRTPPNPIPEESPATPAAGQDATPVAAESLK